MPARRGALGPGEGSGAWGPLIPPPGSDKGVSQVLVASVPGDPAIRRSSVLAGLTLSSARMGEEEYHGGRLVARRLRAHGVTKLFTLSGGHLFSIYDGCRAEGIDIVDVRHEQTAT